MKKEYMKPEAEVIVLTLVDAILASGPSENEQLNEGDFDPDPSVDDLFS